MVRTTVSIITLIALSACSVGGTSSPKPNAPTVSSADVRDAMNEAAFISNAPQTSFRDLPTGTVTYTGQLGADVRGDVNGSILGDLNMDVGFASNTVRGSVDNINILDANQLADQRLDGRLILDGVETAGQLDAFASGNLSGVNNNGADVDTQMLLILDGQVRNDFGRGDAVYGAASGQAEGDLDFDVEGVFYGSRN
ncbi:hypothetical protein [Roseobacter sp. CCS2]|uniref:hypothetical protein n=1 Tax=Roseobacter sp. CCS2 TaxID=391593 RepID=UPI0000F3E4B2|nr:hypothetical protein [Roseobacter sp. CCS2]EBA11923.1 hypothetical protein RCCS2_11539 [Roseobacter sp. CCS2]